MPMTPEEIRKLILADEERKAWVCSGCDTRYSHLAAGYHAVGDLKFCLPCCRRALPERL